MPIQAVSQAKGLWSAETEHLLNETVEVPANPHLDRLAEGTPADELSAQAREDIARYIVVLHHRFPERTKRLANEFFTSKELAVRLAEHLREEDIQETVRMFEDDQFRSEMIDAYDWVWPAENSQAIAEILRREWKILRSRGEPFVTTDRPVWIPHITIRKTFELWFPVSRNCVLVVGDGITSLVDERPAWVRDYISEFPDRQFLLADRFVFAHRVTNNQREALERFKSSRPRVKRRRREHIQGRGL